MKEPPANQLSKAAARNYMTSPRIQVAKSLTANWRSRGKFPEPPKDGTTVTLRQVRLPEQLQLRKDGFGPPAGAQAAHAFLGLAAGAFEIGIAPAFVGVADLVGVCPGPLAFAFSILERSHPGQGLREVQSVDIIPGMFLRPGGPRGGAAWVRGTRGRMPTSAMIAGVNAFDEA